MASNYEVDEKLRLRQRFYARTRQIIEENPIGNKDDKSSLNLKTDVEAPSDLFGSISETEIKLILRNYEKQQQDSNASDKDKPVKCDQVKGGSYAKLLFSKSGFHNPTSTRYLVQDLGVRDVGRVSFACGYSDYVHDGDNRLDLQFDARQKDNYIREQAKKVYDMIEKDKIGNNEIITNTIHDLLNLDSGNGDSLAARGKWALVTKHYEMAYCDLTAALANNCWDPEKVKLDLSEAYYRESGRLYSRGDFQRSFDCIQEALMYNQRDERIILHRNLCLEKLAQQRRPFGATPNSFSNRRR